jgi:CRISPR-associated protein Cas5t
MTGVYVTLPIACFRKGLAREYLETELIPPPATCYGFLLALVGEQDRRQHVGVRVTPTLIGEPETSVVLRTAWRMKERNYWHDPNGQAHIVPDTKKQRESFERWVRQQGWPKPKYDIGPGCGANKRPDYQQLQTEIEVVVWLDSSEEQTDSSNLEDRVQAALDPAARHEIDRFGGLSLGESTHLVNDVSLLTEDRKRRLAERARDNAQPIQTYKLHDRGLLGLPVWVDHVGSANTAHVVGELVESELTPPGVSTVPRIEPTSS